MTRISFPVRGKYCEHVATICLLVYIAIQKDARTWKCPICRNYLNEPDLDLWLF